jgi:hypothetical protein
MSVGYRMLRLLQLLEGAFELESYASNGSGNHKSRLDDTGIAELSEINGGVSFTRGFQVHPMSERH